MVTTVLALNFLLFSPQQTSLDLKVEASLHTDYSLWIGENQFKPGVYSFLLRREVELQIEVRFTDKEEIKKKIFSITLTPGYSHEVTIQVPRVTTTTVEV